MGFILYKLYTLSPYSNPTHHTKLSAFLKKTFNYFIFISALQIGRFLVTNLFPKFIHTLEIG